MITHPSQLFSMMAALVLMFVSGCGAKNVVPQQDDFASIKTIILEDKTDPLILKSSEAEFVAELIETGLKGKGYSVCRNPDECQPDARAVVNTTLYQYKGSIRGTGAYVAFVLTIYEIGSNKVIFDIPIGHGARMKLEDLSALLVRKVINYVPPAS